MKKKSYCVRTYSHEDRVRLVEFLEAKGFSYDKDRALDRQDVLDSVLPLMINLKEKSYFRVGNITCAAILASNECIISDKQFYKLVEAGGIEPPTRAL